jgi:hypothetical protein
VAISLRFTILCLSLRSIRPSLVRIRALSGLAPVTTHSLSCKNLLPAAPKHRFNFTSFRYQDQRTSKPTTTLCHDCGAQGLPGAWLVVNGCTTNLHMGMKKHGLYVSGLGSSDYPLKKKVVVKITYRVNLLSSPVAPAFRTRPLRQAYSSSTTFLMPSWLKTTNPWVFR